MFVLLILKNEKQLHQFLKSARRCGNSTHGQAASMHSNDFNVHERLKNVRSLANNVHRQHSSAHL